MCLLGVVLRENWVSDLGGLGCWPARPVSSLPVPGTFLPFWDPLILTLSGLLSQLWIEEDFMRSSLSLMSY